MRTSVRILLIAELLLGLAPVTALYLYMFPAGLFWTRSALIVALQGTPNAFTLCVAAAFVLGGLGLLSVWLAATGRLLGRTVGGRLLMSGIFAGMTASTILLIIVIRLGAYWIDFYLYGTPVLVALHQIVLSARSSLSPKGATACPS